MPGPTPKDPKLLQRRNKHSTAATLVDNAPVVGMPELPKRKPKWRPEVVDWWRDVWASPMASEYIQADIHGLYLLADLMDRYWRDPTTKLATEIRLQRQCFGLTPIDRRRLQWTVEQVESATEKRQQRTRRQQPDVDPRSVLKLVVK